MEFIKELFPNNKILLLYQAGSFAYGMANEHSDKDYVVILKDFSGVLHVTNDEDKSEYFIFGKDEWIKKMELDDSLTALLTIFPDEVFGENVIHLDASFQATYEKYRNRDFAVVFKKYLAKVIVYFETYLIDSILTKNMWHLYRIEEQVLGFTAVGEWTLEIAETTKEKINVYKANFQKQSGDYLNELKSIVSYLKEVKENE